MTNVVFIDDDALFLKSQKRLLNKTQVEWDTCFYTDPEEALKKLEEGEDAVLVVDWMMPAMDGLRFAQMARQNANRESSKLLYVIMLTARKDTEDVVRALEGGIDDYLIKPVAPQELFARIRVGLRLIESERELLEEGTRHFSSAMRASMDAILIADNSGNLVEINDAGLKLLGYASKEDVIGKHAGDIVLPEERQKVDAFINRLFLKGKVDKWESRLAPVNGRIITPVEMTAALIKDKSGASRGFVETIRDISDLKWDEASKSRFVEQIISAQDEERRMIARELHDETGQWIGSLIAGLTALEDTSMDSAVKQRARELRHLSQMAMGELRRVARGLHPSVLDRTGVTVAIQRHVREFSETYGIEVKTEITRLDRDKRLPLSLETTLYRIIQETLTNVAKHAEATMVSIIIVRQPAVLRLVVEDNGKGFPEGSHDNGLRGDGGMGLLGIKERVALFGGSLKVESVQGEGTTVAVQIPLDEVE